MLLLTVYTVRLFIGLVKSYLLYSLSLNQVIATLVLTFRILISIYGVSMGIVPLDPCMVVLSDPIGKQYTPQDGSDVQMFIPLNLFGGKLDGALNMHIFSKSGSHYTVCRGQFKIDTMNNSLGV